MRVDLFGVGVKSDSPAVTAQKRINCVMELRREQDRTRYVIHRRPGLKAFVTSLGVNPSRSLWAQNSLGTPLLFTVQAGTLYSVNNSGTTANIGTIGTTTGNVSHSDDGTNLLTVDGSKGYTYNMVTPAGLNAVTDGNFTSSPKYATWQDTYFIVSAGKTNQFQLSKNSDPTTWPAAQIGFTGASSGALQAALGDHSVLNLFGPDYCEFWQDTGSPDMPYALIPGSAQEIGLASAWSLAKYTNSLAGLFKDRQGGIIVGRLSGFNIRRISDHDIEQILASYSSVSDALGYGATIAGHPCYVLNLPTAGATWCHDELARAWSEWQAPDGTRFWGDHFALFQGRLCVADRLTGNIYQLDDTTYTDNGQNIPVELWTKHIWADDKYVGIDQVQIDIEAGVGLATGQGSSPAVDLQVSKDGGNSFYSVGFASMGAIGNYTQRLMWRGLGAARDWVLKLRLTDPVKFYVTGASAEIVGGSF